MSRYTTFKYCLDATVEQREVLARHAGASRFAFNQCLRIVKTALTNRRANPGIDLPWTGFDLINAFNAWKKTEDAGRVFTVDTDGVAEVGVTGLPWRAQVCQQVFEEAAVDCGKGLKAWSESRSGKRKGKAVYTLLTDTRPTDRQTMVAGLASTGACPRLLWPPPSTAPRSPASQMLPKHSPPVWPPNAA